METIFGQLENNTFKQGPTKLNAVPQLDDNLSMNKAPIVLKPKGEDLADGYWSGDIEHVKHK